jgi:dTDP-4-amino-4,6-dideoxygalactose transaminase
MIPFFDFTSVHTELRGDFTKAFLRVVDSNHLIAGSELELFEKEFAEYCGARYCVGVGNGLDALAIALRAKGIGAGDEVLVPSQTFIATWLAVTMAGATPVPVEIDAQTYCIDPEQIAKKMTTKTKAVIPVHLYGMTAAMDRIRQLADEKGIFVLEDAAQAHGAKLGGARTGSLGHAAAFSFYPTKNLGALGDAGAIVTDDADLAKTARMIRNYGSAIKYEHEIFGVNSRLDELQAAILRCKLSWLDTWNSQRQALAKRYTAALSPIKDITLPAMGATDQHVFHLYVIRVAERDALADFLAKAGVTTAVHYPTPPHLHGAFSSLELKAGSFPIGEAAAAQTLSLPLWPGMPEEAVGKVIDGIQRFYSIR